MRFWTPKTHVEERNWSVILNPLRNELDKKRVSEKIASSLHLGFEEARELVQNTPIILLDELSHPEALQVQGIFHLIRADVTLTNDSFVKRRCFRALWPERPDLSFLKEESVAIREEKEEMDAATGTVFPPGPLPIVPEERGLEKRLRQLEQLYEEQARENQELKGTLERDLRGQSEKSAAQIRAVQEDWEERYQSLKSEYQEAKAIYEEEIRARQKEVEGLRAQSRETAAWHDEAIRLKKQNESLELKSKQFGLAGEDQDRRVRERTEEVALWREKYQTLAQKVERFESLYEEERKRREESEDSSRQAGGLVEQIRRENEIQTMEVERLRKKFQELSDSQKLLDEEVNRLRECNSDLESRLEAAQRQARELCLQAEQQELVEKRTRLAAELATKEARLREVVLEVGRLRQEIQDREVQAQTLAGEQSDLEREILEFKQAQRHLLEQSKLKEKANHKFRRPGPDSAA